MTRVAINGLGRIGRATLKIVLDTPGLEIVAANDLASTDNLIYLLKYGLRTLREARGLERRRHAHRGHPHTGHAA